jgi:ribose transport system substrate-binding protein
MKRGLIAALVAAGLIAAANGALAKDKYTFALVPKAMNNPFFDLAHEGCMAAEKEMKNIECLYIGPGEHTESEQVQIVQDLIARRVDGIAVSPSNAPAMASALRAAKAAGIPVLTWDSDLLPQDKQYRAAFVGTHNYDIGVNLAKLAQKLAPNGGTLCLQTGGAAAANHNERLQGIRDTLGSRTGTSPPGDALKGEKGWTEVAGCPLITDDDSAKAVQGLTDILAKYPDLTVFITTGAFTQWSDNAFRQAMAPVADKLKSGKLIFLSADALAMQMKQLQDGLSGGQVGQRPFEMGKLAMARLMDLVQGKKIQDPEYTGLDVCTRENAATCVGK